MDEGPCLMAAVVDTGWVNRRRTVIAVVVAICVGVAITVAYRWDRSGVDVVLKAAAGSDALVTQVQHRERRTHSRLDTNVQRECKVLKIRRAFSHCADAVADALHRGGEANLRWGPHAERLGQPVDFSQVDLPEFG